MGVLSRFLERHRHKRVDDIASRVYSPSSNTSIDGFYAQLSRDLALAHGALTRVEYVSHYPNFEILFFYEDGTKIYSGQRRGQYDIHLLSLGYAGEGPSRAQTFLDAAGFALTYDEIQSIKPGDAIEKKDGATKILRKHDQDSVPETSSGLKAGAAVKNLWGTVPAVGVPIATNLEIRAKLKACHDDPNQHAMLALASSVEQFFAVQGEGFYVFDLFGDATLICKMSDQTEQAIGRKVDFFIEALELPTYPVLRMCVDWNRNAGTGLFTFESTPDLQSVNVQHFFDSLLASAKLWVHACRDDSPLPRFTGQLSFDQGRIEYYRQELQKAVAIFDRLSPDQRDYRQAIAAFYTEKPLQQGKFAG